MEKENNRLEFIDKNKQVDSFNKMILRQIDDCRKYIPRAIDYETSLFVNDMIKVLSELLNTFKDKKYYEQEEKINSEYKENHSTLNAKQKNTNVEARINRSYALKLYSALVSLAMRNGLLVDMDLEAEHGHGQ